MSSRKPFRSLRYRLLGPILMVSLFAAILVAGGSFQLGTRWAAGELRSRYRVIEKTLTSAAFPLNATVLDSLAKLTKTELVTLGEKGEVRYSTHSLLSLQPDRLADQNESGESEMRSIEIEARRFLMQGFDTTRSGSRSDGVFAVVVLFDQQQIEESRRRAVVLPLITGLSTILAISSITLVLGSRLVGRIGRLQQRVEAVADGDFQSTVSDNIADEVGRLGGAVDAMAGQLDKLWKRINRQQSEKLLHQIAGGMAHQLRNSLTGARLAIELYVNRCGHAEHEELDIAIHQIELSEDHVRRLLIVASGRQNEDRPRSIDDCWNDVRTSISPLARHLNIQIDWNNHAGTDNWFVKDGPTWVAAVTNLIHNAMEAGDRVIVDLEIANNKRIFVRVADNGEGVLPSVVDELFEPFVTSKPGGMGLGLSVVRRAAEYLGGEVRWRRDADLTLFEIEVVATK